MKKKFLLAASCMLLLFACNNEKTDSTPTDATISAMETKTAQSEIGDAKYTEIGKKMMAQLDAGDMDGWLNNFADNAVFAWSNGDSLAGKQAIGEFWKNRRMNVIESLTNSNDIWIPLKVNTPQRGPDLAGVWLLGWSQVDVKYKGVENKLSFWVHNDYHFDASDKIDRAVSYIDFAPINKALGKK